MKSNPEWVKLVNLTTKIGSGATPRGGKEAYKGGGTALIRSQNVLNGKFTYQGLAFIDDEQAKQLNNVILESNDVLLNITGDSVARVCQVPENVLPARVNQHVAIIRPEKEKLDSRFLQYFLNAPSTQSLLLQLASAGATRSALTKEMIEELRIPTLSLTEQKRISQILGSLDDKIDLNNSMNRTLEEIARTIFKSWFVDFDPVHAKAEGRDTGLPAEISDLFPDSFEASELGSIPKGWKTILFSEIALFIKGVSYSSDELQVSDTALVTLKSVKRGGGYTQEGLKPYSGAYKEAQRLKPGDLVVAHTDLTQQADVVGRVARIQENNRFKNLVASLDLVIVRGKEKHFSEEYIYELLSREEFSDHAYGYTNGTTVLHLNSRALPDYVFALPSIELLEQFTLRVKPILSKCDFNAKEVDTLVTIRDMLLPKLINGEIEV